MIPKSNGTKLLAPPNEPLLRRNVGQEDEFKVQRPKCSYNSNTPR